VMNHENAFSCSGHVGTLGTNRWTCIFSCPELLSRLPCTRDKDSGRANHYKNPRCPGCPELSRALPNRDCAVKGFLESWIETAAHAGQEEKVLASERPPSESADTLLIELKTDSTRSTQVKSCPVPERQQATRAAEVSAMTDARTEIAGLLAMAYRRYAAIQRVGPDRPVNSGKDDLANSCGTSVHGVVP